MAFLTPELLKQISVALLTGVLPALFWLWFWLKEDKRRPEPKRALIFTFLTGALAVLPAFVIQRGLSSQFGWHLTSNLIPLLLTWSVIEETLKYAAARLSGMRGHYFDEAVDAMIYLLTAALGFAAAENVLYIFDLVYTEGYGQYSFLVLGNFRFLGATIIHIVTSTVLGFFIAWAFCADRLVKKLALISGLLTATLLHAVFNYLIITKADDAIFKIFLGLWLMVIITIFFFEKAKKIVCQIKPGK